MNTLINVLPASTPTKNSIFLFIWTIPTLHPHRRLAGFSASSLSCAGNFRPLYCFSHSRLAKDEMSNGHQSKRHCSPGLKPRQHFSSRSQGAKSPNTDGEQLKGSQYTDTDTRTYSPTQTHMHQQPFTRTRLSLQEKT